MPVPKGHSEGNFRALRAISRAILGAVAGMMAATIVIFLVGAVIASEKQRKAAIELEYKRAGYLMDCMEFDHDRRTCLALWRLHR